MCKPVCLSVHLWMDAWSLPSFGYYEYVIHKECCQEHVKEVTRSFFTITAPFNFPIRNAEGPNFSTSSPIDVISGFLIAAILMGVKQYLMVVFICISQMTSSVEHLFMCLLDICIFSLIKEKSIQAFAHFLIGSFFVCCIVGLLYIFWMSIPCQICDQYIFSPILWVTYSILLAVSVA